VREALLDWCGFFEYSPEEGTYAVDLPDQVTAGLMHERIAELRELQDSITAAKRDELIDATVEVLVDEPGLARSHREAPQIDGIIRVPTSLAAGSFATVRIADAQGPDLVAEGAASNDDVAAGADRAG